MMFRNRFGTKLLVAWLAFLLAGFPLPVIHSHASIQMDSSHDGGLQAHYLEFSHIPPGDAAEETWHVHWIVFHLTDQIAGISTTSHIDVLANTTTLETAVQVQDIYGNSQSQTLQTWLFCSRWLSTNRFGKTEASSKEINGGSFSHCMVGYCQNSPRLLI